MRTQLKLQRPQGLPVSRLPPLACHQGKRIHDWKVFRNSSFGYDTTEILVSSFAFPLKGKRWWELNSFWAHFTDRITKATTTAGGKLNQSSGLVLLGILRL